jgi:hypothetical protein
VAMQLAERRNCVFRREVQDRQIGFLVCQMLC